MFFFYFQARTFQEACVMVRRPALEIIHAMKHMNYYLPIPKFVLCILHSIMKIEQNCKSVGFNG